MRYRATGTLKQHLGHEVRELEDLHDPKMNKWAAKLFKSVKVDKDDPSYQTALRIAQIPDDYIKSLVGVYGPESREETTDLPTPLLLVVML
jgi:hypothetical protein